MEQKYNTKYEVTNNQIGDDAIHFSNSKDNKNLDVHKCFGDCIDFDYSRYELENLNINKSGNDGLDFMESTINGNNIRIAMLWIKEYLLEKIVKLILKTLL